MNETVLIGGMALVTFLIRYPALALLTRFQLPERVLRALKFVPPAVLAAIILPSMLYTGEPQTITINYTNAYLVAGIFSALVAWRTKNLLITIVAGMAFFLIWRALFGYVAA